MKTCRQSVPGVFMNSAYPTPTPEPQPTPSLLPDEDVTMVEDDDAYDYDPTLEDEPMDEQHFDADETLVNDDDDDDDDDGSNYGDGNGDDNGPLAPDIRNSKAEWSEDTVQTEAMSRLGICINTAARVVVCIACASVIRPLELPTHFSKTHPPMSISATFCQELTDTYNLCEDPLGSRPGMIITAIYGLDLMTGYLSCDTCGYACRTENRIKTHIGKSQECRTYRCRYAQAYRSSSNRMYFGVVLQHASDQIEDPLDPFAYLKAKFAPLPFNQVPISCPAPRDANHFLNLEHWHKHVEGRTGAEIHQGVREREPKLRSEVRVVMERYAKDAIKKLEKLDDEAKGAIGDYLG